MTALDKHEDSPAMTLSAAKTNSATMTNAQSTIYSPVTTNSIPTSNSTTVTHSPATVNSAMMADAQSTSLSATSTHSAATANTTLPSSTLPGLPVEVCEKIASHSQLPDLANMRLTCKSLCIASTSEFARTFPSERRFVLTVESLEGLMKMTAHPIIGPRFTKISFNIHRIADDDPQDTRGAFEQHKAMLTQALINLQKCKNVEATLGIFDEAKTDGPDAQQSLRLGHGYSKSYGTSAPKIQDSKRSLSLIFEAAAASNYPFHALEIDFISEKLFADRAVLPFITYGLEVPAEVSPTIFRPERNICLKHTVVSNNPIESTLRFDPSCGLMHVTGSVLTQTRGLLVALIFTPFRTLVLREMFFELMALSYITQYGPAFETLEVMHVNVESSYGFLHVCRRATFLQRLVLHRVVLDDHERPYHVLASRYVKWEGQQAIQAGLRDFILKHENGYTNIDEDA
ncbi:hypothetical protein D6D28_09884 [Aureobasidium pullulans]|uniref:F-box domain-containing protein n=1 Tax=Aureobasidium pullulans TaxID=5580 RepID=A0A4S8S340_AURPU|nr:hypothetical protein D6D28_09884 [Aureobasidium pullulans]